MFHSITLTINDVSNTCLSGTIQPPKQHHSFYHPFNDCRVAVWNYRHIDALTVTDSETRTESLYPSSNARNVQWTFPGILHTNSIRDVVSPLMLPVWQGALRRELCRYIVRST